MRYTHRLLPGFATLLTAACHAAVIITQAPTPTLGPAPLAPARPPGPARERGLATVADPGFSVDTSSREAVRQLHAALYGASEGVEMNWTGNASLCQPGTTAEAFQVAVLRRINYFRALVGVPGNVTFDSSLHAQQQSTALIMAVNHFIGHDLPDDAECYTAEGDAAAGKSNLAIGTTGPDSIDGYMRDPGPSNSAVGHRRWVILPQNAVMATGDAPETDNLIAANALFVLGDHISDPRPAVRDDFVAWPPPGYVPYPVVPIRWSFSYPDADLAGASVSMSQGGAALPVTLEPLAPNRGENTIAWYPSSMDPSDTSARWPQPGTDTTYDVTVANVGIDGQVRDFNYQVIVFDPAVPGPDTVLPELSGPATAPVGSATPYTYTSLANIPAYEWLQARSAPLTAVEGADVDLGPFVPAISAGYDPRGQKPKFQTSKCFLLTHPIPEDQFLTHSGTLLPGSAAKLKFETRVSNATSDQVGQVQISEDDGGSWKTIWSRAGDTDDLLGDLWFNPVEVSLTPYAGRLIRVRFVYHFRPGGVYVPWNPSVTWHNGIGFYIEDVSFEDVDLISDLATHQITASEPVRFNPASTGNHVLAIRGLLFGVFPLEWGPPKQVTALPSSGWTVQFSGPPQVVGGQFQAELTFSIAQADPQISVEQADSPTGPWTTDASAGLLVITPGLEYRLFRPADGDVRFLRVRVQ